MKDELDIVDDDNQEESFQPKFSRSIPKPKNKSLLLLAGAVVLLGLYLIVGHFLHSSSDEMTTADVQDSSEKGEVITPNTPESNLAKVEELVSQTPLEDIYQKDEWDKLAPVEMAKADAIQEIEKATGSDNKEASTSPLATEESAPQAKTTSTGVEGVVPPAVGGTEAREKSLYSVQVNTFTNRDSAEKVHKNLLEKGYKAYVSTGKAMMKYFEIQVGEFQSAEECRKVAQQLAASKIGAKMVYLKNKRLTLSLGQFFDDQEAHRIFEKVKSIHSQTVLAPVNDISPVYIVRVGKLDSIQQAQLEIGKLKKDGYHPIGITDS